MPITWQNIRGANLAEASRPLEMAQRTMDNALDKFGNILKQREDTDVANWQTGKVNNTNAALAAIQQYGTPEEFQAAQKTGALQALLGQNGAQIDQREVRGAIDGRLAMLQQRAKQGIDYKNTMVDDTAAPLEDAYKAAAIRGDTEEMNRIQSMYAGRNKANLLGFADERKQIGVTRERAGEVHNWAGQDQRMQSAMHSDNLLTNAAQRNLIGAQTNAATLNAETNRLELNIRKRDHKSGAKELDRLDKAFKEVVANGPLSMGTFDTAEGKKNLMEGIKNIPGVDEGDAKDILYNLGKYFDKGITVGVDGKGKDRKLIKQPLPVATILEEIAKSADNPFALGFSRRGDDLANNINKRFGLEKYGDDFDSSRDKDRDVGLIEQMRAVEAMRTMRANVLRKYAQEGGAKK